MRPVLRSVLALAWIPLAGCVATHDGQAAARDIVRDEFPDAQEAVRSAILELNEIVARGDWEGLRAAHLESPKFSDVGTSLHRSDFEEMIQAEVAAIQAMNIKQIDWRDLRVDVFGDVAVSTVFPVYSGMDEDGGAIDVEAVVTFVHVSTPEGWKIAHEHVTLVEEGVPTLPSSREPAN